jgi:probable F420-dependent oxidoreductase
MEFGFQMLVSTKHYAAVAPLAEEAGFTSLHVPDHLVYPAQLPATYPYSDDGVLRINGSELLVGNIPTYDPFGLLCYLAACTREVRLVPSVCIAPLYHPLFLARAVGTVDRLSGGRITLGVGVGWLRNEFVAAGESFEDRGPRTDRIIEILRRLWAEDVVEQHDGWYDWEPVRFNPKPLRGQSIPIHVGGAAPAALRRAGTYGDGWIEIGSKNLDELARKLEVVHAARVAAGRDHLPFEVTTTSTVVPDGAAVRRGAALGVTRVIAIPDGDGKPLTPDVIGAWAARYAEDVMAAV